MKAYRYEDVRYAGSEEGERGPLRVELREYDIIKETPKGFWIDTGFSGKRFVLVTARKRFALKTKDDALVSFKARKLRQLSIYQARVNNCKEALYIAENINAGTDPIDMEARSAIFIS